MKDLKPEQGVVYAWRSYDSTDNLCKIGKSTVGKFHNSVIMSSKRWHPHGVEILGIEVVENEAEALIREKELHTQFGKINNTEFVYLSDDVLEWLETHCIPYDSTLADFYKEAEANRGRQRRANPNYRNKERQRHTAREKERRETDPEYREYLNTNARAYKKRKRLEVDEKQLTFFD